jgi:hypothetical protein
MSQVSIGSDVKINSGVVMSMRVVTPASEGENITINSTSGPNSGHDYAIAIDTDTYGTTVKLPTTSGNGMEPGRIYYVCDHTGSALTHNITVDPGAGSNISGQSTVSISTNFSSVTVVYVTTNKWQLI